MANAGSLYVHGHGQGVDGSKSLKSRIIHRAEEFPASCMVESSSIVSGWPWNTPRSSTFRTKKKSKW
jgi:hypothetical protein